MTSEAHAIFAAWIRAEHAGARRRAGVSFRAAADMHDLWHAILAGGSLHRPSVPDSQREVALARAPSCVRVA